MTTRKKRDRAARPRITPEALQAWRAGDWHGLFRALHLPPWHYPPYLVDLQGDPPDYEPGSAYVETWSTARDLRLELERLAGPPGKR